ncbi:hypothetical protein HYPSUDRAFT_46726 [Hypholoma sublateritium FD-334 SS-4]|uniref:Uncharacterized protein n=1 Tax=Hypholoma sublateritium (strain FD-334 SS-4) TaxID=945553 RepID=A0A0D2NDD7_HYPSF|nr:hypothetical protein HYPSUDRAFT_46726 [Hypholoma sublateritium FD-334 SS-4]
MFVRNVHAAVTASSVPLHNAPTCQSGFQWAFNLLGQSPCDIAFSVEQPCPSPTTIPTLPTSSSYPGPSGNSVNPCTCSTVYYSLLSACALCQNALISSWQTYNLNCEALQISVFIPPLTADIAIPNYAFQDVTATPNGTFDEQLAMNYTGPDTTASVPITVTFTSTSFVNTNTETGTSISPAITSTRSTSQSKKTIEIAVVTSCIGVLLVLGCLCFIRTRKTRSRAHLRSQMDGGY